MALVGEGLTNDEIAARLVVSPATAKTHVSRAMVKLQARDRAQLVVMAYETGPGASRLVRLTPTPAEYAGGPLPRGQARCLRPYDDADARADEDRCRQKVRQPRRSHVDRNRFRNRSQLLRRPLATGRAPGGRSSRCSGSLVRRRHRRRASRRWSAAAAARHAGARRRRGHALAERFAAGEIDEQEYRERLAVLKEQDR